MKKTIIVIVGIVIVILAIFTTKYLKYKKEQSEIKKNNLEYEVYLDEEIFGTELTTVINKAVDNNESNEVSKDEQGFYIQNDINSIEVEIKIIDLEEDITYKMETLYNGGMIKFVQFYNSIKFKCSKIEYNSQGKVKYLLFEQTST